MGESGSECALVVARCDFFRLRLVAGKGKEARWRKKACATPPLELFYIETSTAGFPGNYIYIYIYLYLYIITTITGNTE